LHFRTINTTFVSAAKELEMNMSVSRRTLLSAARSLFFISLPVWSRASAKGDLSMLNTVEGKCAAYMDAWSRKDLDAIGALLHPKVHFKGPMQELNGREAVLAASQRIFPLLEKFVARQQLVSGERAMFAYDFICREPIGLCRTAELIQFEDGLIRETELFFDARPFEALQRAQAAQK
jgi:hypothetical protein